MPTNFTPERRTLGSMLSGVKSFVVPDWQRSYSWRRQEVELFWNDISHFSALYPGTNIREHEYFIGSVVIIGTPKNEEILDGQQRLATSVILLSALRDEIATYKAEASIRLQQQYLVAYDDATNERQDKLTLNIYDRDFFRRLVLDENARPKPKERLHSHRLIAAARAYFVDRLADVKVKSKSGEAFFQYCLRIKDVVCNYVSVVTVTSEDEDAAAALFEVLNDRGLGLSTADLLKNYLMRKARASERSELNNIWGEILEIGNDAVLKSFLRHYWISLHGDVKTQALYNEIKSGLESAGEGSLPFTKALKSANENYDDLLNARSSDPELKELFLEIGGVGASALYPALLSSLDIWRDQPERTRKLARALLDAYVRHNLVAGLEASQLEAVVYKIASEIRKKQTLNYVALLRAIAPSDKSFVESFRTFSPRTIAGARLVLGKLEMDKRSPDETQLARAMTLHVEHIYPQAPSAAEKYKDHDKWVGRLGNLTLLGRRLNSAIRNSVFRIKKPAYSESDIAITKELARLRTWNKAAITKRQTEFAEQAVRLWPL